MKIIKRKTKPVTKKWAGKYKCTGNYESSKVNRGCGSIIEIENDEELSMRRTMLNLEVVFRCPVCGDGNEIVNRKRKNKCTL